jgi:glucosamine--fructose-6-phosphate aminotransferase (isomerizing)
MASQIRIEELSGFAYVRDLLDQPRALADTIAGLEGTPVPRLDPGPVVLTGMGGSFEALHPLHLRLTGHGFTSVVVETSELIHYQPALLKGKPLVVVSQSGRGAEVVRLLEMAEAPAIAVTNTPGSPLAERARCVVMTRAGEEWTVSCKTYVTTLAALEWLGAALCGETSAWGDRVEQARRYLNGWQAHVAEWVRLAEGIEHLFLVGRGASLAAAGTGGLILKESAHFHAEGMSSAAFRHGPLEMLARNVLVCVFEGDERTAGLNRGLAADIERSGGRAALIGPGATLPALRVAADPILEILPVQMLSLALGARAGHEPGRFTRLTKVTTVE